jgi:uncharacterized protein DUF2829
MNFAGAIKKLRDGEYLTRKSWEGALLFVEGDEVVKSDAHGQDEWIATSEDLLADDWAAV